MAQVPKKASQHGALHKSSGFRRLTKRVPSSLNVVGHPVVDGLVVLLCVRDVLVNLLGVVHLSRLVPGAHVNANGEAIRVDLLRSLNVDVPAHRGRRGMEARMVRGELATEGCKG